MIAFWIVTAMYLIATCIQYRMMCSNDDMLAVEYIAFRRDHNRQIDRLEIRINGLEDSCELYRRALLDMADNQITTLSRGYLTHDEQWYRK